MKNDKVARKEYLILGVQIALLVVAFYIALTDIIVQKNRTRYMTVEVPLEMSEFPVSMDCIDECQEELANHLGFEYVSGEIVDRYNGYWCECKFVKGNEN